MAKTTSRAADADDTTETAVQGASTADASGDTAPTPTPRTRRKKADAPAAAAPAAAGDASDAAPPPRPRRAPARKKAADAESPQAEDASVEAPKTPRRTRAKKADAEAPAETAAPEPADDAAPKPPRRTRAKKADAEAPAAPPAPEAEAPDEAPKRRRTRTTRVEAEPVASSDNLPAEPRDDRRDEPRRDEPRRDEPRRDEPRRDETRDQRRDEPRDQRRDDRSANQNGGNPTGGNPNGGYQNQGGGQQNPGGYDEEGGGRRRNKRKRNKNRGQNEGGPNQGGPNHGQYQQQGNGQQNQGQYQGGGQQNQGSQGGGGQQNSLPAEPFEGILELIGDKKFGFVRQFTTSLTKGDNDPFMPPPLIQKYRLRDGVTVKGMVKPGRKGAWQVVELTEVMGGDPEAWAETPDFDDGLVVYPDEKLRLVVDKDDISMRVVDLVAPIGKGQRGLIVAPPRAGKTILIKQIAAGLSQNHPDVKLVALLIDERPEEVTDFRRNTNATVFASSNDYGEDNHIRVATIAFEFARRLVEQGADVVILLDSLTRLGRTFNMFGSNLSGRTMSGGIDARALLIPRKIFGSARNIENGGSLTIVATALIETGSRMDEVIFEEFKGTGNSEIVLDREMAEQRIYPAINVRKSGTRNEDRLVDPNLLRQRHMLLRALNSRHPVEAMQALAKQLQLSGSNEELLQALVPE